MSTYIYLHCVSHTPPISSDGEVGQHLSDIADVREMFRKKHVILANHDSALEVDYGHWWKNTTARFICNHRFCDIIITDEYSREYSIHEFSTTDPKIARVGSKWRAGGLVLR